MKSKDLSNHITEQLIHLYPFEEAQIIAKMLLESGLESDHAVERLLKSEPIQYVLGEAHFYGRDFKVTPEVLIPRRETEELVYQIIQDHPKFEGQLLDIGTGSGCIPITIKAELPNTKVDAIDISAGAIDIARGNAETLGVEVDYHQIDILTCDKLPSAYDVIVSNPPYVTNAEKGQMQKNVLSHEPHLALFVEDQDPLLFYNKVIDLATKSLHNNGWLYFEINERFGKQIAQAMEEKGFEKVSVIKDMQGKDRIVKGSCAK